MAHLSLRTLLVLDVLAATHVGKERREKRDWALVTEEDQVQILSKGFVRSKVENSCVGSKSG